MADAKTRTATSITTLDLLGVLFVGLKLGGVIDWSWWYVTMPFWIVPGTILAVIAVIAVVGGIAYAIVSVMEWLESRKTKRVTR